jgi:hypothetical protein
MKLPKRISLNALNIEKKRAQILAVSIFAGLKDSPGYHPE